MITATSAPPLPRQKSPAANRAQTEHIEVIRGRLENRNLKRITQSRHSRGQSILRSEPVEDGLAGTEMGVAGAESGKSTVCSLKSEKTCSTRPGSLNGMPRKNRSLIKLKIAVLSPIPSVRVITAEK